MERRFWLDIQIFWLDDLIGYPDIYMRTPPEILVGYPASAPP